MLLASPPIAAPVLFEYSRESPFANGLLEITTKSFVFETAVSELKVSVLEAPLAFKTCCILNTSPTPNGHGPDVLAELFEHTTLEYMFLLIVLAAKEVPVSLMLYAIARSIISVAEPEVLAIVLPTNMVIELLVSTTIDLPSLVIEMGTLLGK